MSVCQVIVVGRRPLSLPFFDYEVPPELTHTLQPGQLVKVPFRTSFDYGIVASLHSATPRLNGQPVTLKPVVEIVNSTPALSQAQLQFLTEMSQFYQVSPGFLVKSNLFEIKKKTLTLFSNSQQTFTTVQKKPAEKPTLFIHQTDAEKKEYLLEQLLPGQQNLILVPEVYKISHVGESLFGKNVPLNVGKLSSDTLASQVNKLWLSLWSGETEIIIATRRALMLPWHKLANIFVLDEASSDYKSWDMAPRFETRDAVRLLGQHHQAQVHLVSQTPSAESFYFAKKKVYSFGSTTQTPYVPKKIELVDMHDERRGGNYSHFADASIIAIRKALQTGNVLVLAQHRGSVSAVACRDCGFVPRCAVCSRTYSYHEDTGKLVCHFCKTTKPMLVYCEKCQGTNLAARGIGTQKIERELKKILRDVPIPLSFRRIDSDMNTEPVPAAAERELIIGTEQALAVVDWKTISLTLLIDPDTLLFIPEYRLAEELWQTINTIDYLSPPQARVLIQTAHTDNAIYKYLKKPEQWYAKELLQRKFFGYPPFNYLLKLSFGHTLQAESERQAKTLFARLSGLTKSLEKTMVMSPLATTPAFYKRRYWQVILIKVDYTQYKKTIKEILTIVPSDWKVDPNPLHILGF